MVGQTPWTYQLSKSITFHEFRALLLVFVLLLLYWIFIISICSSDKVLIELVRPFFMSAFA